MAELGHPRESRHYLQVQVQGVTIHLHTGLTQAAEAGLTLRVDGFWYWRKLFVESTQEDDPE